MVDSFTNAKVITSRQVRGVYFCGSLTHLHVEESNSLLKMIRGLLQELVKQIAFQMLQQMNRLSNKNNEAIQETTRSF